MSSTNLCGRMGSNLHGKPVAACADAELSIENLASGWPVTSSGPRTHQEPSHAVA